MDCGHRRVHRQWSGQVVMEDCVRGEDQLGTTNQSPKSRIQITGSVIESDQKKYLFLLRPSVLLRVPPVRIAHATISHCCIVAAASSFCSRLPISSSSSICELISPNFVSSFFINIAFQLPVLLRC
ncbi:hypothetical protein SDJN02_05020, partial [Cucurbita argyrosperma subsp. argyrosperma]